MISVTIFITSFYNFTYFYEFIWFHILMIVIVSALTSFETSHFHYNFKIFQLFKNACSQVHGKLDITFSPSEHEFVD